MIKIGDFARLNKVTVKTLRYYDSLGLLQPEKVDNASGYRYYSTNQMIRLDRINILKYAGFSLDEISLILNKDLDPKQFLMLLELKHAEITDNIKKEQEKLSRVKDLIYMYEQGIYSIKYDIEIKPIEPMLVATIRETIPAYSEQGRLWKELMEHIIKHNGEAVPPFMTIYHNSGPNEESVDAEVIKPIVGELPETDRIKVRILEGIVEMASLVHKGAFESLHLAYKTLLDWIERNNYEIIGSPRELYHKYDWKSDYSNDNITEIQFPVRKLSG
ncbi:MAG: MerR family transcriptional regulator [Bacillota bacterium]|nr:MerR family transcriptional regulator [Bacillota bacterium]